MTVKAKCNNCGSDAPADQFKLHYQFKQMVCANCFNGRNNKPAEPLTKKEAPPKPPGWDAEDEYLNKVSKLRKEENQAQFTKVAGTNQIKCRCANCKFSFKYDPFRKRPNACPYCNGAIPKFRTYNLL